MFHREKQLDSNWLKMTLEEISLNVRLIYIGLLMYNFLVTYDYATKYKIF